jgi:hypothetical protein
MTDGIAQPALERVRTILERHASVETTLPADLARRVLEHEHAVQFDATRFEASGYIRGLVNETLDGELGPGP